MADKVSQDFLQLALVFEDESCPSGIKDGPDGSAPVSIVPPWQIVHLSSILHNLNLTVLAQATHPKTIETKKTMYKRSKRKHAQTVGGAVGVACDWPVDCSDETFWKGLSEFEQDTISKTPKTGTQAIADKLSGHCGKGKETSSGGPVDKGSSSQGKKQYQSPEAKGTPAVDESRMIEAPLGRSGSRNLD